MHSDVHSQDEGVTPFGTGEVLCPRDGWDASKNACRYHSSMSRLPSLAILLAILALPAHALDLGGNWTKSEMRNVIVYSNARDFTTKAIVSNIERMRGALGHIMGLRTESAVPTTIFVFDGEAAFAPVRKAVFGARGPELAGFFTHSVGRFFVAMETDAGARGTASSITRSRTP